MELLFTECAAGLEKPWAIEVGGLFVLLAMSTDEAFGFLCHGVAYLLSL